MDETEAFETECPHCGYTTLIPAMMNKYERKQGRYYSEPSHFCCIRCAGSIEVKAHRRVIDVEKVLYE